MIVLKRKNLLIRKDLSTLATQTWAVNMKIPFDADTVVVKQITYNEHSDPTQKADGIFFIHCTGMNEVIGSFYDGSVSCPNFIFPIVQSANANEWIFTIQSVS